MDKYEFNIKVEQIKKMAKVGDYAGAMKAADEIDWRRVSSVSLLTLVSEIYEKNRDYAEAKEILILAYERAPIGKRLLYKLTMLALQEGNIPEAEAYYREFYDLAPEDSRQHILRYLILKAKGAPADQLINTLEQYIREELDEHWMYELAELYHKAGRSDECIAMCDQIMLMFGIGKYVDKAMDLKLNQEGVALTEYQQSLIDKRDNYEVRLKDMEEHPDKYDPDADAVVVEKPENYDQDNVIEENGSLTPGAADPYAQTQVEAMGIAAAEVKGPAEEIDEIVKADLSDIFGKGSVAEKEIGEAAEQQPEYTAPQSVMTEDQEIIPDQTEIIATQAAGEAAVQDAETDTGADSSTSEDSESQQETIPETQGEAEEEMTIYTVNFIVERRKEEDGVNAAIRLLKLMHEHTGSGNRVAKIKAGRLNMLGVLASRDKLAGKDLIVEQAGDLTYSTIEEVMELIKAEPSDRVVVLIDNPMQIRKLLSAYPELLQLFHVDKEEDEIPQQESENEEDAAPVQQAAPAPQQTKSGTQTRAASQAAAAHEAAPKAAARAKAAPQPEMTAPAPRAKNTVMDEELDIDDFANYAQEYAESIDCSISGKSKLALYERIELMEEDGIRLTRENAVALIEEAADKAEKKSLGSLFKAKYDKDDKLILREEHFVD